MLIFQPSVISFFIRFVGAVLSKKVVFLTAPTLSCQLSLNSLGDTGSFGTSWPSFARCWRVFQLDSLIEGLPKCLLVLQEYHVLIS
jgi:hypothetical protein